MIARTTLLLLLPFVAAFSLTRKRRIVAVIGMGMFSLILAAVYLLLNAPDVAITEAAIGRHSSPSSTSSPFARQGDW